MRWTAKLSEVMRYAGERHDLVTTDELHAFGLYRDQITVLVRDGLLERVIRGLYRIGGSRTPLQDIAATVQRHVGAVGSHTSALFAHDLDVEPPGRPHFTLEVGSSGSTRLGIVHRSPLDPVDRTLRHGIPVTTVARSIVDGAALLSRSELARVVDEAISRKVVLISQILEVEARLEASPGRVGSGRLREAMAPWAGAIEPDSVAEAAVIRRIRSAGLPAPIAQHQITDANGEFVARVDLAWPEQRVIREYESLRWHGATRIERDEERYRRLEALGWSVEPLHRHHLLPGETAWLAQLRSDLARNVRSAS